MAGYPDALRHLSLETWLAGGAFPRAPEVFPQAYSIRAKVRALYPSVVYLALYEKTGWAYARTWRLVAEISPNVQPSRMPLDFGAQSMDTFRRQSPGARLSGCHFHVPRGIIRKLAELGLNRSFETDDCSSRPDRSLGALMAD